MAEDTELATPQVMNVKIVNRNDFPISDRFDGVPYVFEQNRAVAIPIDAANHIFGWYPEVDMAIVKRHVQKRMGWNTPDMDKDGRAERFWQNLDITPILYRMVPVEAEPANAKPPVAKMTAEARV